MNPRRSFTRKVVYLVAIAVLLVPLFWLSQPATRDTKEAQGSPGGLLAQMREEHGLSQSQLGEIDPTSETIKLATLGLRGVAANILWSKANHYKMVKDWTNLSATLQQLAKLQPHFPSVWRFQGWNLSYNVSAEFDDYRERYRWVINGIKYLKRGIEYNEREPILQWDIGWFSAQKIGRADEHKQFRRMFKEDDDYQGSRPLAERDNWLVGREWFLEVENMVDTKGCSMKGKSPLIFRSNAPMCSMNYADALEKDGTYGEVAKRAWKNAARGWREYGDRDIPTSFGVSIRLNEQEMREKRGKELVAKLDALSPGLREKIIQQRRDSLTDKQRAALDTPPIKRTAKQHELAGEANEKLKVTHEDVAKRVEGAFHQKALQLAKQAMEAERTAGYIDRYRQIVNFKNWRLRAEVEQTEEAVTARKYIYQGEQAFAETDLQTAREQYNLGLAAWRKLLDKFPSLIQDQDNGEDLMLVIDQYRELLGQLDDKMPEPFILQDIINLHQEAYRQSQ